MDLALLAMLPLCFTAAIPLGRLRKQIRGLQLNKPPAYMILSAISVMPLAISRLDAGYGVAYPLMLGICMLVTYNLSYGLSQVSSHLRAEAGSAFSASVNTTLKLYHKNTWICRVFLTAVAADATLLTIKGNDLGVMQYVFAIAFLILACIPLSLAIRKRKAMSDAVHETELERFRSWVDRVGVDTLVHMPDASAKAMDMLKELMDYLSKQDIKAGIVCRGRKSFTKVQAKYGASWLVRTTHDLDAFALPPIKECLHMPVGTNGSHFASLRKITHTLVDLGGIIAGAKTLPKEMRMFNRLVAAGDVNPSVVAEAGSYGIKIVKAVTRPHMPVLHQVPTGAVPRFALILAQQDLLSLSGSVPLLDDVVKVFGNEFRLSVAFEGCSDVEKNTVFALIRDIMGHHVAVHEATPQHALNRASNVIWTQNVDKYLTEAVERNVVKAAEDLDAVKASRNAGITSC